MEITYYYYYGYHSTAAIFGYPFAEIETRYTQEPTKKVYLAHKVWRKIGDNPIEVYKSRDSYEFDEAEFIEIFGSDEDAELFALVC